MSKRPHSQARQFLVFCFGGRPLCFGLAHGQRIAAQHQRNSTLERVAVVQRAAAQHQRISAFLRVNMRPHVSRARDRFCIGHRFLHVHFVWCVQATMSAETAEQVVRARLGAARVLLERAWGSPTHASVSRIQMAAVVECLRGQKLTAEDAASLLDRVLEIRWTPEDAHSLLAALQPSGPAVVARRSAQDYEAIVQYCTEDFSESHLALLSACSCLAAARPAFARARKSSSPPARRCQRM